MSDTPDASKPTKVFFSYAHQDEPLRDRLAKHLKVLHDNKTIESWHDRQIGAGTEWEKQIDENLEAANIILLLVSSDFLGSNYCRDIEMKRAMQRHESGEARVIPVILRQCGWRDAAFGKLQALPPGGKPVTSWKNKDEAFAAIVQGIKRVIAGQDPVPPVWPNKRQKFLKWAIEEKHWPLLLSFIIPLYFVINYFVIDSGLHERTHLILGGIASFIIGILYWAIRRQSKRLWPSGFLGIVGAGLIVVALLWPMCILLPGSNNVNPVSKKQKLVVTIARFSPDVLIPRSYARSLNDKFQTELSKQQALFTIKTYNAEVEDKEQEKIDRLSDSCPCDVFVSAVVRRSNDNGESEEWADFKLSMPRSDSQKHAGAKPVEPKNIIVKNQKEYDSLVKLLVAFAYYQWGQWDDAIDILKQIRKEKEALSSETYFYEGLCRFNKALQISEDKTKTKEKAKELMSARDNFKDASQWSNESISLNVASQFNLAYMRINLSRYLPEREAVVELNSAITALKDLSERWKGDEQVKKTIGDCDPTKVNLTLAYFRMHQIENKIEYFNEAQKIINEFNATCPEEEAICKVNFAQLLANVSLRSDRPEEFEAMYKAAITNVNDAREYFEKNLDDSQESKDRYLQNWVAAVNSQASKLANLGRYLGSNRKDELEQANELYEKALRFLSKDKNLDDWAWIKSNQASTLVDLCKLNPTDEKYYDYAFNICKEILDAYVQPQGQYWVSAKHSQAIALCLLGSKRGDKELLESSLKACEEVSNKVGKNTTEWDLNEKTWGDAYFQLSLLSQDNYNENRKQARSKYEDARSLCTDPDMLFQKVCSEIDLRLNDLSRHN